MQTYSEFQPTCFDPHDVLRRRELWPLGEVAGYCEHVLDIEPE